MGRRRFSGSLLQRAAHVALDKPVRRNSNGHTYSYTNGYTCDYANCYPYTNANANFDSYSNGNRNRDAYTYGNFDSRPNIYSYANGYCKCYSDGHTHVDAETVANGTTWTIDKAASHASAKAVGPESQACHVVAPSLRRGAKAGDQSSVVAGIGDPGNPFHGPDRES